MAIAKNADYSDWSVQLAKTYKQGILKPGEWFALTQKIDGCRATFFGNDLVSRGGKIFKGFEKTIIEELNQLRVYLNVFNNSRTTPIVFDGELVWNEELYPIDGSRNAIFKKSVGIANATKTMMDKEKLKFVIFDMIPYDEFVEEKSRTTFHKRFNSMLHIHNTRYMGDFRHIELVPTLYFGTRHEAIVEQTVIANSIGWEGLMLNTDGPYTFAGTTNRRSSHLFKIKQQDTVDLKVVGFYEEIDIYGKPKNRLGGVACIMPNDNSFKEIKVGSGFTADDRETIWADPSKYYGKTIEVAYAPDGITFDKQTGMKSLQQPIFKGWRYDK